MAVTVKSSTNLYQKLLLITEEVGTIAKTGKNQQQGYGFIEAAQISADVRVQLAKHGVMIIPETVSKTINQFTNAKGTTMFHANVVSRFTLVNADNPEERMVCEWDGGEALDSSDKATNKAITASNKYFLMKLFNISDKEDPDTETHEVVAPTHYEEPAKDISKDEPITSVALDKLTNAVKLKGIATLAQQKQVVNALASQYGVDNAADLSTQQGREVYIKIRDTDKANLEMLTEPF